MDEFFSGWFGGLDEGLRKLSDAECGRLFAACAARCAEDALKYLYNGLWAECGGDADAFFASLHRVDKVDGRVVEKGRVYEWIFTECNCPVHTEGKVDCGRLCECSRQSIIAELGVLMPEKEFTVTKVETILDGGEACRFRIERVLK